MAVALRTDVRCSSSMRRITCNVLSMVCCVSSCRAMVTRSEADKREIAREQLPADCALFAEVYGS